VRGAAEVVHIDYYWLAGAIGQYLESYGLAYYELRTNEFS
jgi:hypothetical protein